MYALLIDSSTERSVAALSKDGKVIVKKELPLGYQSSRYLMPAVDDLFKESALSKHELAYIVVGVGPGSYTGMRVAAAIGKTLAFSLDLPLVGVCTLLGFIPSQEEGPFVAILDARIGGAYMMKGCWNGTKATFNAPPSLVSLDLLGDSLEDVSLLVTSDKEKLAHRLKERYPYKSWSWEERAPAVEILAEEGHVKFLAGEFSVEGDLEILYLRKTHAELERS